MELTEYITDLLIDFDEMGFAPTTSVPNPEAYAIEWRKKITKAFNELTEKKSNLEYTLLGVMHSVDKWLDGKELEQDEVNIAATMREKTLQIVEKLSEENERLRAENERIKI